MKIAIASGKGGTGKTTIAVNWVSSCLGWTLWPCYTCAGTGEKFCEIKEE